MKSSTRKKAHPYPNKSTLWSYFMQAIEPSSQAINEAFPGHHPMWVVQSQNMTVSAEQFKYVRQYMLSITQMQCAAYMRVNVRLIQAWEQNKTPVPFMALELLRLVHESPQFRLSNEHWQGWFINQAGRLVSPDTGNLSFVPSDLNYVRQIHQSKAIYEAENIRLRAEIAELQAENVELRDSAGDDGLLDELKQIEARLAELSHLASKKNVVKLFPKDKQVQTASEAKCA